MKKLVILPTYNESKNIIKIIDILLNLDTNLDILVVDDNSPDNTAEIVRNHNKEKVFIEKRAKKNGLGSAYIHGFNWALDNKYDKIIQMDADLSHDPDDIPRLLYETKTADLIIGSRYSSGVNVINWPMRRLVLSYFANWYARFIIGHPIYDLTGGFKCFKRKVLESIDLSAIKSEGYSFQIEMNFLAWVKGFNLKEIPIVFTDRTVGESKMNRGIIVEAIIMVPKLLIKKLLRVY